MRSREYEARIKEVKRTHAIAETIIWTIILGAIVIGVSVAYNGLVSLVG